MSETTSTPDPRVQAATQALHSLNSGDSLAGQAAALVAAIDAADDRVRLTLPQFHDIKAETVSNLSIDLHSRFGGDPAAAEVLAFIEEQRALYGDRYIEPADHEEAMASLIRERLALSLRSTADRFDAASLQDITEGFDFEHGMAPRTLRKVIQGCADWLRTSAQDLEANPRRPYRRVDTRAVIDEDRHTAVLGVIGRLVRRSRALAERDGRTTSPFILTDMLVEELDRVGASVKAGS
ncbi:hypothetical protein [Pseudarthrobacter sp. BIM B-2242]|uniref:hypothetical protein n=1 Tax=Pseudarthrobacter sp. BIM B-2242 TaxID=2772401 RepID=UPI00168A6C73|nr:hypothetical protein [Pseudarthrobacter sp. BIM B-2242]QOD06015.1 hypothetical protein IDT60_20845 [Pseudarthrobacter sp. BIM B-2242]